MIVCENCGLVVSNIEVEPSYELSSPRSFDEVEKPRSRAYVHPVARLPAPRKLGSYIDDPWRRFPEDAKGNRLGAVNSSFVMRLKELNERFLKDKPYLSNRKAYDILRSLCRRLELPEDVLGRAMYLFSSYSKKFRSKGTKSHNIACISACCLLIAIRERGSDYPITVNDVVEALEECGYRGITSNKLFRYMKITLSVLGLKVKPRTTFDFSERVFKEVQLSAEARERLKAAGMEDRDYFMELRRLYYEILRKLKFRIRRSRNPYTLCVAAMYGAMCILAKLRRRKNPITQSLLARICNVAEYSLREHWCLVVKDVAEDIALQLFSMPGL